MKNIIWTQTAWNQYAYRQKTDKKIVKRINELIIDISRNRLFNGIEKPEPLKNIKACSERINDEHRLIYNYGDNNDLIIYVYLGHYEK